MTPRIVHKGNPLWDILRLHPSNRRKLTGPPRELWHPLAGVARNNDDGEMAHVPLLAQINLVVRDMDATLAFYRRLGRGIETPSAEHAVAQLSNGMRVEFDTTGFTATWDSGFAGGSGGTTLLGLAVESRDAVDDIYADLVAQAYSVCQPPYDAFWGSRYAIVEDPDGNRVGLMSPVEESARFWPPSTPPRASS